MITRTEQQQNKQKRKRGKTDWERLVEQMEREGGYADRVIVSERKHDRRERRAEAHS